MNTQNTIAIIDSGGANITSVQFALERLGRDSVLTTDPDFIYKAPHVILPGVGTAQEAMQRLQSCDGLVECIKGLTQPVMGVCLGMQLLFTASEEGNVNMLDIIQGQVKKFRDSGDLTIPHMGWNDVILDTSHPLCKNFEKTPYFYFVHSYYAESGAYSIGTANYGHAFSATVSQDNFMGCQFHPERSSKDGAQIFKNFLAL